MPVSRKPVQSVHTHLESELDEIVTMSEKTCSPVLSLRARVLRKGKNEDPRSFHSIEPVNSHRGARSEVNGPRQLSSAGGVESLELENRKRRRKPA